MYARDSRGRNPTGLKGVVVMQFRGGRSFSGSLISKTSCDRCVRGGRPATVDCQATFDHAANGKVYTTVTSERGSHQRGPMTRYNSYLLREEKHKPSNCRYLLLPAFIPVN